MRRVADVGQAKNRLVYEWHLAKPKRIPPLAHTPGKQEKSTPAHDGPICAPWSLALEATVSIRTVVSSRELVEGQPSSLLPGEATDNEASHSAGRGCG